MRNKPLQIGLTGGIGTGKTVVSRIFNALGIPSYNADAAARRLMENDPELKAGIKELFGEEAFSSKNALNRDLISSIVFKDQEKLTKLNDLVHPSVGKDYVNWVDQNSGHSYLIKEAALIFEAKSNQLLDKVVTVYASPQLRIERIMKRDPFRSRDEIEAIIHKQMDEEKKVKLADHVIYNDETRMVIPQVLDLHKIFLQEK